jgi:hypothetical protein
LDAKPEQVSALAKECKQSMVTFVFGSKEEKLNNAAALKEYIMREKTPRKEKQVNVLNRVRPKN